MRFQVAGKIGMYPKIYYFMVVSQQVTEKFQASSWNGAPSVGNL